MVSHLIYAILFGFCAYVHYEQNDFPQLKYALLGSLGLLALIQRE